MATQRLSLRAGDGHQINVVLAGPQNGIPVVVFHGGPGAGSNPSMLDPFDTQRHRVVLIDQRGTGRSRPQGRLQRNLTHWLLRDVDMVRRHLGFDSWYVMGGSWGATLAIAYAGYRPEAVRGLILRGTFLASAREIRGLLSASRYRAPQAWGKLYKASGAERPTALLPALYACLQHDSPRARAVAQAYSDLEKALLARVNRSMGARSRIVPAHRQSQQRNKYLIQTHYLMHACGLRGGELTTWAARAARHNVSGIAIHGKHDPVCPITNLQWLAKHLPLVRGISVDAGHLASDQAIRLALRRAVSELTRTSPETPGG